MRLIKEFLEDEAGATAIEYVLIAGLVSIAIIGAVRVIGLSIQNKFYGPLANNLT